MALTNQDLADIRSVVVDAINESFELLSAPRFDALETRMDRLEARMDRLEVRMEKLEVQVGNLEVRMTSVERRVGAIEARLEKIEADMETLKNDVEALYRLAVTPLPTSLDEEFEKLDNKEKLRVLRSHLFKLAEQSNIKL